MTTLAIEDFSARQRLLSLAAVISTSLGVGISFGIGYPLTALTLEGWAQPKWMIGLAGAAPAIAVFIALPFVSRLITRVGPVAAIASGCIFGSIGFLALYMFQGPWSWIVIRVLMSAGFAMPWLAGETWINAVATKETRGRVIGAYAISFFTGYAIGPVLLQFLGISGITPFLAAAVITISSGLPIIAGRRLAPAFCYEPSQKFASAFFLVPSAMVAALMAGFSEITILSLLPNVALASGWAQQPALALLTVMTVGGILLQLPLGWLSDKVSRITLFVCSCCAYVGLLLLLPWALQGAGTGFLAMFLIGGVTLGFYSLGLGILGERVGPEHLTRVNGAFIVIYEAGAVIGPFASGVAMTGNAVSGFITTTVGLTLLSIALLVIAVRSERRAALG
jgi:MFS family permease